MKSAIRISNSFPLRASQSLSDGLPAGPAGSLGITDASGNVRAWVAGNLTNGPTPSAAPTCRTSSPLPITLLAVVFQSAPPAANAILFQSTANLSAVSNSTTARLPTKNQNAVTDPLVHSSSSRFLQARSRQTGSHSAR